MNLYELLSLKNNTTLASITQEIVTARDGQESLIAKLNAMTIGEGGGTILTIESKTETATITLPNDKLILCNATTGAIVINLPAAATVSAKRVTIKKTDDSINTVTADGDGAETINGAATLVIEFQYSSVTLISNGTSWDIA